MSKAEPSGGSDSQAQMESAENQIARIRAECANRVKPEESSQTIQSKFEAA